MQLALATGGRVEARLVAVALFAVALSMAWRLRGGWVTPVIVGLGAVVGWAAL
ncbi:hypothetical protein ACVOMT_01810 [Sphingomonas panni]